MDEKQVQLSKLQEEFLNQSNLYMTWVKQGRSQAELKELYNTIRSLLAEIKAVEYDIKLKR